MKTIFLIRHAKSSWANPGQNDFDRPLNDRGKADASFMAKRLNTGNIKIDALVASPAKRAKKTCESFAEELKLEKEEIIFRSELYLAPPKVFEEVICSLNDAIESAAIFSHNPGITDFANTLTATKIDDMPTCSIYAIQIKTNKWKEFVTAKKEFLFFDYPKMV